MPCYYCPVNRMPKEHGASIHAVCGRFLLSADLNTEVSLTGTIIFGAAPQFKMERPAAYSALSRLSLT